MKNYREGSGPLSLYLSIYLFFSECVIWIKEKMNKYESDLQIKMFHFFKLNEKFREKL